MTTALAALDIDAARLPERYEAARAALTECSRIDECQAWANAAERLASYAKQSKDTSLRMLADRIQARAVRRCGELLRSIESAQGAANQHKPLDAGAVTRHGAAAEAGLSVRQRVTALRVANVPAAEFERQVESNAPPTVTALADQGRVPRHSDIDAKTQAAFQAATVAMNQLRKFTEALGQIDPEVAAAGISAEEADRVRGYVGIADHWLDRFVTRL